MKVLLPLLLFVIASLLGACTQGLQNTQAVDPQNPMGADQVSKAPSFTPQGPGANL